MVSRRWLNNRKTSIIIQVVKCDRPKNKPLFTPTVPDGLPSNAELSD